MKLFSVEVATGAAGLAGSFGFSAGLAATLDREGTGTLPLTLGVNVVGGGAET